jgi:hypothetical protein
MMLSRLPALFATLGLSLLLGGCVAVPMAAQALSGLPGFAQQAMTPLDGTHPASTTAEVVRAPR